MSPAKKKSGWVLTTETGAGTKLHVPTNQGMFTFEDGVPREAPDELAEMLKSQGYDIKPADVEAPEPEPEPEKPADQGAFDYDSASDERLRKLAHVPSDSELSREELIERVKELRGD